MKWDKVVASCVFSTNPPFHGGWGRKAGAKAQYTPYDADDGDDDADDGDVDDDDDDDDDEHIM